MTSGFCSCLLMPAMCAKHTHCAFLTYLSQAALNAHDGSPLSGGICCRHCLTSNVSAVVSDSVIALAKFCMRAVDSSMICINDMSHSSP